MRFYFFYNKKNLIIFFRAINNTQRTKIKQKNTYDDGKFSISQVMLLYWRQTFDKQYFSFFILLYHVNFSWFFEKLLLVPEELSLVLIQTIDNVKD